jgi:hypothetical protein
MIMVTTTTTKEDEEEGNDDEDDGVDELQELSQNERVRIMESTAVVRTTVTKVREAEDVRFLAAH